MDPITAVGFAASILMFVDFSWSLIKGSYEVYELGTTSDNKRIASVLSDLDGITKSLQSDVRGDTPHVKDLKCLAAECVKVSEELSTILKDLEMKEGNKVWHSLEAKWKSMRKEKEIGVIEQKLVEYRLQLLLRLNLMLSEQQSSVKSQLEEIKGTGLHLSSGSLDKLTEVHQAIKNMERRITGELLQSWQRNESENVVNTSSLLEIHRSLSSLVSQLQVTVLTNTGEVCILRKLYFNSIHSRSEAILDAESGTFGWLLEDERWESELSDSNDEQMSQKRGLNGNATERNQTHEKLPIEAQSGDNTPHDGVSIDSGGLSVARINLTESEDVSNNDRAPNLESKPPSSQDSEDDDEWEDEGSDDDSLTGQSEGGIKGSEIDSIAEDSGNEDDSSTEDAATSEISESVVRYPQELELHEENRQSFLNWLNSGNGIYHISGKAGSGKSTLMKSLTQHPRLIEELKGWARDKKLVFASFYFWRSVDVQQKSLEGLYRSLLFEILNQCPELIKEVFPKHWHNAQKGCLDGRKCPSDFPN